MVVEELLHEVFQKSESTPLESMQEMDMYLESLCNASRTAKLWVSFLIKAVMITITYVPSEREADFPLHMMAVNDMLPFFFAAGHSNYARFGFYYH